MKSKNKIIVLLVISSFIIIPFNAVAQKNASKEYAFIQDAYNLQNKKLHDFLIVELNQFIKQYPDSVQTIGAYTMLANVYDESGDKHRALASCYKTVYLFPDTVQNKVCTELAQSIIENERRYRDQQGKL